MQHVAHAQTLRVLQGDEQPAVAAANGRQKATIILATDHRLVQGEMVRFQRRSGLWHVSTTETTRWTLTVGLAAARWCHTARSE